MCILKLGYVRERCVAILVLVALDVSLILKINTVFIAQIVPIGGIGIVGAKHVVDFALEHQHHLELVTNAESSI